MPSSCAANLDPELQSIAMGSPQYPVLDPEAPLDASTAAIRATQCAFAVMSKAPRAGKVKTRLSPPLTLDQSAALNICFLRDTARNLADIAAMGHAACLVSYTPIGDESLFNTLLPAEFSLIPQRGDGFGERLFYAAQDILRCGYGSVCLIDSDSPTVPTAAFEQARQALALPGDRVVLGPSQDGGYYLIGLKRAHPAPFTNISWSTATVADETRERCCRANLQLVELPLWYDVDDAPTLTVLYAELLEDIQPPFATSVGYPAPHTRTRLLELRNGTTP